MDQRTIWIAGDWQHADFAEATAWLREQACILPLPLGEGRGEGGEPEATADRRNACASGHGSNEAAAPHAILLFQSRPGQISRTVVEQYHARAPLARLVALVGPWCEGEQRSGRPWPGVVRVAWRNWHERLPQALGLNAESEPLPRTATEADRLQHELAAWKTREITGFVAVRTSNSVNFEVLQSALAHCGFCARWANDGQPATADLEIIDGWEHWPAFPGPPRILLLHFPRPDDLARAQQRGAAVILAQPLLLADLRAAINRMADGGWKSDRVPPCDSV
jgi:hypothetical protein